jgi:uncharacterized C2H2 Zn-finger protein
MRLADGRCQCRLCDKVTTHIGNMRQHFITHHISQERIRCRQCGNSFKNKNSLAAHVSSKHRFSKGFMDHPAGNTDGNPAYPSFYSDSGC